MLAASIPPRPRMGGLSPDIHLVHVGVSRRVHARVQLREAGLHLRRVDEAVAVQIERSEARAELLVSGRSRCNGVDCTRNS